MSQLGPLGGPGSHPGDGAGRNKPSNTDSGFADQGMRILSYLIGGIAFYGGIGWLVDRAAGSAWALPTGIIVGMVISVYVIIKRFGSP